MDDLIAELGRRVPYWKTLGLELLEVGDGRATMAVTFRPEHLQNGVMHGGVVASLVDSVCACSALSLILPDAYGTSVNLQVTYLKPVTTGRITARAECLRAGRRVLFTEARVQDEAGDLVATGTSQLVRIPLAVDR
jgi:uncharacterized protein (TIGR00369 family)